jgi:hypothetical protein
VPYRERLEKIVLAEVNSGPLAIQLHPFSSMLLPSGSSRYTDGPWPGAQLGEPAFARAALEPATQHVAVEIDHPVEVVDTNNDVIDALDVDGVGIRHKTLHLTIPVIPAKADTSDRGIHWLDVDAKGVRGQVSHSNSRLYRAWSPGYE